MNTLEEFLLVVFGQMSQCGFDKARDLCRKEKNLLNNTSSKEILLLLPNLFLAEKCYMDLGFFSQKNRLLLRKESSLRSTYISLHLDFSNLHKIYETKDEDVGRIIKEITTFLKIRIQLVELYDKMYTLAINNKYLKIDWLISHLQLLKKDQLMPFLPTTLVSMKTSLGLEMQCLLNLLNAQFYLENWELTKCTVNLCSIISNLATWGKVLQNKESWRLNFLKSNTLPELYQWMVKFKSFLLGKFSLYFYVPIREHVSLTDLKTACMRANIDFINKFQTISRRGNHEATCMMLVFEACGLKDWTGPGYYCALRSKKDRMNDSYYVIARYPEELQEKKQPCAHLPVIKRVTIEHFSELLFLGKSICYYNKKDNTTYFLTRIEERITLVSFYDNKRDDKESEISGYMCELASSLRCHKYFTNLRHSTK